MPYKTTTGTTENLSEFLDDQIGLQLASVALLGLAMIPICTGSFSSLRRMKNRSFLASRSSSSTSRSRSSSRIRSTIRVTNAFEDTDDEEGEEKSQILTIKDAFLFPIIASGLVYAVYLTINEVKPVYVHQAIRVITSILYCAVFSNTSILVAKNKLPSQLINQIEKYKFSFSARDRSKLF
jgi:minor histocompatibility antigen H13